MSLLAILALACALAMDAFAVAVVSGLTLNPVTGRQIFRMAFHFGLFQAMMPAIGWAVGSVVHRAISAVDHWVAFGLLLLVGGRMIWGALREEEETSSVPNDPTSGWSLIFLSVATSIDALAVGLTLAMIGSDIVFPALVIGIIAAGFTASGMLLGRRIGSFWGKRVEAMGGVILVAIGIKIVLEHTIS